MQLDAALAARRSCRAFDPAPIDAIVLERVLGAIRRAPAAGNTWALDLVVLDGPAETSRYWDVTLPAGPRRARFGWPHLLDAPVLVVPYVRADAYVERYRQPDKAAAGLGADAAAWPVPYWWVDAGAAVMAMLLAATAEGLGSLLFGQFGHADDVRAALGVPDDRAAVGTVALGRPAAAGHRPSASAGRPRPSLGHLLHRGRW